MITVEAVGLLSMSLGIVLAMLVFAAWNKADIVQHGNVELWWDNRWRHGWRMPEGVTALEYGKAVEEVCQVIGMEARVNGIVYGEETISPALSPPRTLEQTPGRNIACDYCESGMYAPNVLTLAATGTKPDSQVQRPPPTKERFLQHV